jgi:hypothetical protein
MSRFVVPACLALLGVAGCAATTQGLEQVNQGLGTVNAALADPGAALARYARGCRQTQRYELGTRVEGEWTASDCRREHGGVDAPVDLYTFSVSAERDMVAMVRSPGVYVELALLGANGASVVPRRGEDNDIGDARLATQLPPGTYTLAVGIRPGSDPRVGSYLLTTSTDQVGFNGCLTVPPLALGSRVEGTWSVSDCISRTNPVIGATAADYYLLSVAAEREVTLALESPGIMARLEVLTREGARLHEAQSFSSQGTRLREQFAPGTYIVAVKVSHSSERKTGRYTLSAR